MERKFLEENLPINGKKQYLLHFPSENKEDPVVLFLGSIGLGGSPFAHKLAQIPGCTLVCWDPLGAGKTLTENPMIYPTVDIVLKDLFIVVSCLKIKYWKQKIILMGQGSGTFLTALYALRHPTDLQACVGVSQMVSLQKSGQAVMEKIREKGAENGSDLKKLERLQDFPGRKPSAFRKKRSQLQTLALKYGLDQDPKVLFAQLRSGPAFHWADYKSMLQGRQNNDPLWQYLLDYSLEGDMHPYKMPFYMILGQNDPCREAALQYLNRLRSPVKEALTVENASSCPILENPDGFQNALLEILSVCQPSQ